MGSGPIWLWCLGVLIPDWDVPAWRELIRGTARTSLLFFLLASHGSGRLGSLALTPQRSGYENSADWGLCCSLPTAPT